MGVSQGLPPPSRKKQAVTSLLFQVAEESSTTQLLEKLKEIKTVSPEKIKSEPEDEALLSISEELIDWPPEMTNIPISLEQVPQDLISISPDPVA